MSTVSTRQATAHALLTAAASLVCLLLAEALQLEHSDLAVWTTFLVMAQYTFTSFQKGLERIVGRGLGILAGLVVTTWFNERLWLRCANRHPVDDLLLHLFLRAAGLHIFASRAVSGRRV